MGRALRRVRETGYFQFVAQPQLLALIDSLAGAVHDPAGRCAHLVLGGLLSALFSYLVQEMALTFGEDGQPLPVDDNPNLRRFLIDDFFNRLIDSNARMDELCSRVH